MEFNSTKEMIKVSVHNPILRGFNPDPSIVRVGMDYYIATSTFEWFPGVQIHHSKDLVNWNLISRPLDRLSQLDMSGNPDSCGVWAPCLSYDNGIYYLVYSNVRSFDGVWKDTPNYLVTSNDIKGPWSEPIYLGSYGFDGSLFHDVDGKKWFLSMLVDHRKGIFFGGIVMQEYDFRKEGLVGTPKKIFEPTSLGLTEAPHIYLRKNYYYLITAEGGTEYGHAVTIARSKELFGPFEVHPQNPIITCRNNPDHPLQKSGHADMVESAKGEWFIVFLIGRPLNRLGRCTLGRETAMERIVWKDDWPYLANGTKVPRQTFSLPVSELNPGIGSKPSMKDHFDNDFINIHFQSLRVPVTEDWASLNKRKGYLRITGRESLSSFHSQSLIAHRVQSFQCQVNCCLEFNPDNFQQMAGLICYYNTSHFHYLQLRGDSDKRKVLNINTMDKFQHMEPLERPIEINSERICLKVEIDHNILQFTFSTNEIDWIKIGPVLDASILSDDYVRDENNRYRPAFTGMFVGICCQDLSGMRKYADFDWFEYDQK